MWTTGQNDVTVCLRLTMHQSTGNSNDKATFRSDFSSFPHFVSVWEIKWYIARHEKEWSLFRWFTKGFTREGVNRINLFVTKINTPLASQLLSYIFLNKRYIIYLDVGSVIYQNWIRLATLTRYIPWYLHTVRASACFSCYVQWYPNHVIEDYFSDTEAIIRKSEYQHICVGKLSIIGSDNGLSPGRRQAIIWTKVGTL